MPRTRYGSLSNSLDKRRRDSEPPQVRKEREKQAARAAKLAANKAAGEAAAKAAAKANRFAYLEPVKGKDAAKGNGKVNA